jgi:hypothetical protein
VASHRFSLPSDGGGKDCSLVLFIYSHWSSLTCCWSTGYCVLCVLVSAYCALSSSCCLLKFCFCIIRYLRGLSCETHSTFSLVLCAFLSLHVGDNLLLMLNQFYLLPIPVILTSKLAIAQYW